MPRYKLTLEFDGTDYAGWQRQKNGPSVQESVENAVKGYCGETATVHGAGRTDAGVHALAMVAHVDLRRADRADTVRDAVNFHLRPAPIAVVAAKEVDDRFHARFSCIARHYRYDIVNRRAPLTLALGRAWRIPQPLDHNRMNEAAQCLVGKHDFTTFRATLCQAKSPIRTLSAIAVSRSGERLAVTCHAPSFLHHQVRSIVGSLCLVGRGDWTAADLEAALIAADRTSCGPVAPAHGLYFARADYPDAAG